VSGGRQPAECERLATANEFAELRYNPLRRRVGTPLRPYATEWSFLYGLPTTFFDVVPTPSQPASLTSQSVAVVGEFLFNDEEAERMPGKHR